MHGRGAKREHEAGRRTPTQRGNDLIAESGFPIPAVEPFAGDDPNPAKAVLLAVSNESKHFPLGLAHGEPMQVALRLDLEPRVLERVKHASVRVGSLSSDDSVALPLDDEASPGRASGSRRRDGSQLRNGYHALVPAERLHPCEGPFELASIPVVVLAPSHQGHDEPSERGFAICATCAAAGPFAKILRPPKPKDDEKA